MNHHPPWFEAWWEAHGAEVLRDGLRQVRIQRRFGLSHFKARRVADYARHASAVEPLAPRVVPSHGRRHLIIGDAHAKPNQDLRRFEWLAIVVSILRPDVVVCIGDWFDMESLSSYDRGKRSFEGRRYVADIEAGNEALRRFHSTLERLAPGYAPRFVVVLGNHCARIDRATNDAAEFEGMIGMDDLDFARRGWEVHPFKAVAVVDGVHYSHFFPSGIMGKPISGEYPAANLIKKGFVSCAAGHSHLLDTARRVDPSGRVIRGVVVGCYFEHDEDYAGPANRLFWRGLVLLHDVRDGDFDVEELSMARIRCMVGSAP